MEITPEVAQTMIDARFHEYPQMKAVAMSEEFHETLAQILDFEGVDKALLNTVENEIVIILTLYAPLHELAQNIQESTGLPEETSQNIAKLIETLIFQPVIAELQAYDFLWEDELAKIASTPEIPEASKELKERLILRPKAPVPHTEISTTDGDVRPLTREDVLSALTPARTMHDDVADLQKNDALGHGGVVHGYEAFQKLKDARGGENK